MYILYIYFSSILENSGMVLFANGTNVDTSLNSEFTFGTASVTINPDSSFNVALDGGTLHYFISLFSEISIAGPSFCNNFQYKLRMRVFYTNLLHIWTRIPGCNYVFIILTFT